MRMTTHYCPPIWMVSSNLLHNHSTSIKDGIVDKFINLSRSWHLTKGDWFLDICWDETKNQIQHHRMCCNPFCPKCPVPSVWQVLDGGWKPVCFYYSPVQPNGFIVRKVWSPSFSGCFCFHWGWIHPSRSSLRKKWRGSIPTLCKSKGHLCESRV